MRQEFNIFNQVELPSIALCKPNKEVVRYIETLIYNTNLVRRFNAVSEFTFTIPKSINTDKEIIDSYSLFKSKKLIRIGTYDINGNEVGDYYIITTVTETDDGSTPVLDIECQSLEAELMAKKLTAFTGTFPLLTDPSLQIPSVLTPAKSGILNYICDVVLSKQWSVGTVELPLRTMYRTFDISDTTVYSFLVNDLEKAFNCLILFNTEERTINAYELTSSDAVKNTNIFLSYDNLLRSSEFSEISDEIATKLYCYGGGNLDIRSVNPLGDNAVYNFDYYTKLEDGKNEWMSDNLRTKINDWKDNINNYLSSPSSPEGSLALQRYNTTNKYLDALFNIYTSIYLRQSIANVYTTAKTKRLEEYYNWNIQADGTIKAGTKLQGYTNIKTNLESLKTNRNSIIEAQQSLLLAAQTNYENHNVMKTRRTLEYNASNIATSNVTNTAKSFRLNAKFLLYGKNSRSVGTSFPASFDGKITPTPNTTNYTNDSTKPTFDNTGTTKDNGYLFKNSETKKLYSVNDSLSINNTVAVSAVPSLPLWTGGTPNKVIAALFDSTYAGLNYLTAKVADLAKDVDDYNLNILYLTAGHKTDPKPTTTVSYDSKVLNKASNEITAPLTSWSTYGGLNDINAAIATNNLDLADCATNANFLYFATHSDDSPSVSEAIPPIPAPNGNFLNNSYNKINILTLYQWKNKIDGSIGFGGVDEIDSNISYYTSGSSAIATEYYKYQTSLSKRTDEYNSEIELRDAAGTETDEWADHDLNAYFLQNGLMTMSPPTTTSSPFSSSEYVDNPYYNKFIKYKKNVLKTTGLYAWGTMGGLTTINSQLDIIKSDLMGYTEAIPEGISINEIIEILSGNTDKLDYASYNSLSTHFSNSYWNEESPFSLATLQTALTAREGEYEYEQAALKAILDSPEKDKKAIADHTANSNFLYNGYPSDKQAPTAKLEENQLNLENIYEWSIYGGIVCIQTGLFAVEDYSKVIYSLMQNINNNLKLENNFTENELKELSAFTFENTYQNENIIETDSMLPNQVRQQSQYLYDQSMDVLSRASQPRYEFSIESVNFLNLIEYKDTFTKEFELGCKVIVDIRDNLIETVLLEVETSFDNPEELNLTFSNRLRLDNSAYQYSDLIGQTVRTGASVSFNKLTWSDWSNNYKDAVSTFITSSLNAAKNKIINSTNQEIIIDDKGLRARRMNSDNTEYEGKQVWLTNNSLVFTDNNWQEAKLAIGEIQRPGSTDPNDTVYGIIADKIIGNIIAGNSLEISNRTTQGISALKINGSGVELYNSKLIFKNTSDPTATHGLTLDPVDGLLFGTFSGDKINKDTSLISASMDGVVKIANTVKSAGAAIGGWRIIDKQTDTNFGVGLYNIQNPDFFMYTTAPTTGGDKDVLWKLGKSFVLKKTGILEADMKYKAQSVSGSAIQKGAITSSKIALNNNAQSSSLKTTGSATTGAIGLDKFQPGALEYYINPFDGSVIKDGELVSSNFYFNFNTAGVDNCIPVEKLDSSLSFIFNISGIIYNRHLANYTQTYGYTITRDKLKSGFGLTNEKIGTGAISPSWLASGVPGVSGSETATVYTNYTSSTVTASKTFTFNRGILTSVS